MKILTIGTATSPHILGRAKAFLRAGISNKILSEEFVQDAEIEVISPFKKWEQFVAWKRPYYFFKNVINAIKVFYREDYDIIHIHYAANYLGWIASLVSRKPIVIIAMGGDVLFEQHHYIPWYQKLLVIEILKNADLIIAKSPYLKERICVLCNDSSKVLTCIFGVEKRFLDSTSTEKRKNLSFLSLRPLNPFYHVDKIIDVITYINKKGINATFNIVCFAVNERYKKFLEEKIVQNSMCEKIHFLSSVQYPVELLSLYQSTDIVIALPTSDGIPQSALEGMAQGCVNVLPKLEVYKEIFDENNVILVSGTASEIGEKIIENIGNLEKIRAAGRKFVENFGDLEKNVDELRGYFKNIIAKYKGNRKIYVKIKFFFLLVIYFIDQFFILGIRNRLKKNYNEKVTVFC